MVIATLISLATAGIVYFLMPAGWAPAWLDPGLFRIIATLAAWLLVGLLWIGLAGEAAGSRS